MRNDYADVTLVVDRSGSMQSMKKDAEGGIRTFIEEQRKHPGKTTVTLVEFDGEYNFVYNGVDIKDFGDYSLVPRGSTALLDAVGRAINETGSRLSAMSENDRPAIVLFVIVTDGQENASKEFTLQQIKEMIQHQQEKYSWNFDFLAANQDAFAAASSYGIHTKGVANFSKADEGFKAASSKLLRMKMCASFDQDYSDVAYNKEELENMK